MYPSYLSRGSNRPDILIGSVRNRSLSVSVKPESSQKIQLEKLCANGDGREDEEALVSKERLSGCALFGLSSRHLLMLGTGVLCRRERDLASIIPTLR